MQFALSIILLAGTMTVYRQVNFMMTKDLGLNIDRTVVIPVPRDYWDRSDPAATAFATSAGISAVTYASAIPGEENSSVGGGFKPENATEEESQQVYSLFIAKNYFDFLAIPFLAGRAMISNQLHRDSNLEIVINGAARKAFQFEIPDDALGKLIYHGDNVVGRICGVVKDHHSLSLDNPIDPTFYQYASGKGNFLLKLDGSRDFEASLQQIQMDFIRTLPNNPFEFYFLDDFFA